MLKSTLLLLLLAGATAIGCSATHKASSLTGIRTREIYRTSRLCSVWPILKWMVIGYETPQVWEMYLRISPKELPAKVNILFKRLRSGFELWKQSNVAMLHLSGSPEATHPVIDKFLTEVPA